MSAAASQPWMAQLGYSWVYAAAAAAKHSSGARRMPAPIFTPAQWAAFTAAVRSGEFDLS